MPESGKLKKLIISAYSSPDYSGSAEDSFEAYFNPDEYIQTYEIEYDEAQGSGTTGSPMKFKRIKPKEYSLKFVIDGTGVAGVKVDVSKKIKEFLKVIKYDGNIHRTRYLKIIWGTLISHCVLLKAEITYRLFNPDGSPLRAVINATFRENVDDETRVRQENRSSPDLAHIRTVKEGDTLPMMSYRIYGDISYYIRVAEVNGLDDFRCLKPGMMIKFPPLEK